MKVDKKTKQKIGKFIEHEMIEKGLSKKELFQEMGITQQTGYSVLSGVRGSHETWRKAARALDIPITKIEGLTNDCSQDFPKPFFRMKKIRDGKEIIREMENLYRGARDIAFSAFNLPPDEGLPMAFLATPFQVEFDYTSSVGEDFSNALAKFFDLIYEITQQFELDPACGDFRFDMGIWLQSSVGNKIRYAGKLTEQIRKIETEGYGVFFTGALIKFNNLENPCILAFNICRMGENQFSIGEDSFVELSRELFPQSYQVAYESQQREKELEDFLEDNIPF